MRISAFIKLLTIILLAPLALGLTACTPTNFKPAHHTSAYECERLQGRGHITHDQTRDCRMGQPFSSSHYNQ